MDLLLSSVRRLLRLLQVMTTGAMEWEVALQSLLQTHSSTWSKCLNISNGTGPSKMLRENSADDEELIADTRERAP